MTSEAMTTPAHRTGRTVITVTEHVEMGRAYRLTASPSLLLDQWPLVEVFVSETATRSGVTKPGHWRILPRGLKRDGIVHRASATARAALSASRSTGDQS